LNSDIILGLVLGQSVELNLHYQGTTITLCVPLIELWQSCVTIIMIYCFSWDTVRYWKRALLCTNWIV